MQVIYPYLVGRSVRPPRCRNSRMLPFEESRTLEIPEVTGAEAPVAFLRTDPMTMLDDMEPSPPQITQYRWWNGQLWVNRPVGNRASGGIYPAPLYENDMPSTPQESSPCGHRQEQPWWDRYLEDWRSRRLIVAGQWYQRALEPRYQITTGTRSSYASYVNYEPIRVVVTDWRHTSRLYWHHYYPLNWKTVAFEHARLLAAKHNQQGPQLPTSEFRIFIREAIQERKYHVYGFEIGSPTVSMRLQVVGHSPQDAVAALQETMGEYPEATTNTGTWGCLDQVELTPSPAHLNVNQIVSLDAYLEP